MALIFESTPIYATPPERAKATANALSGRKLSTGIVHRALPCAIARRSFRAGFLDIPYLEDMECLF
jgi:hypothetical protein